MANGGALYGIYGARGHGRDVLVMAEAALACEPTAQLVYVDDDKPSTHVCGYLVLTWGEFLAAPAGRKTVAVAPSSAAARRTLAAKVVAGGIEPWRLTGAGAVVSTKATLGAGALIGPNSVVSANVRVGDWFQMNTLSNLAHDCTLGDFVTFAPGVMCNGFVEIGDRAYVGAGALLKQGIRIGHDATIGMGAVVTKDVPDGEVWAGNPARRIK